MKPKNATARAKEIFEQAIDLASADERSGYVKGACAGEADLLALVQTLLRAHDGSGDAFLPESPGVESVPTLASAPMTERPGTMIGRYKLLQAIGEGGCGTVFMAEQEEPVRRRVALKVIKLGMDTKEVIGRFEAERQALAMMDHPNIAKVLDAGATEAGRPFFVMELVRGIKITDYCDQHNLPTVERLKLFSAVCHAIQHAHQKGIIHRDIKPSNILVTVNDGVPVPKVIDFGIAKATLGRLTDRTVFTAFEQFIGTPAYMSPEQAEMSSLDIDTRSDVYSLGVLLYELLTGRTPFEAKELLQVGLDEMRRHIREVEPPRPSTRLRTLEQATLSTTAEHRHTAPPKLIALIHGDLDCIVMRCLEKDRTRRYETATSLAQDLQRHLDHEPVVARPAGTLYRLRKLVRRNRLAFAGAAAVVAALVLGILASTWQAVRANRAERSARSEGDRASRAERAAQGEAARAQAVNDFLVSDLLRQADSRAQADAKTAPNPDLKVREALDRAAEKVGTRFKDQPLTEAAVRHAIGSAYDGVGDPVKATLHLERALQLRKPVLGAEHRDTLASMNNLAGAYLSQGKAAEAAALHAQTWEIQKRVLGAEHPDTLTAMNNLAGAYYAQGKLAEAATLHARTWEVSKRVRGAEHPDTLAPMNNLACAYSSQGKHAEAATLHAQIYEVQKRVRGADHPTTLTSMANLAAAYHFQGKAAEAVALNAEVLEILKRVCGPEYPGTLTSMNNLACAYSSQGKHAEAATLHAQTWEIQKRVLGAEHPDTLTSMGNLASAYRSLGKATEAATLESEVLEMRKRVLGAEHPDTLTSMNNLAGAYSAQGKHAEAATLHAQTWEISKRVLGADHPNTLTTLSNLALAYQAAGQLAEARPLFEEILRLHKAKLGPDHADTVASMGSLATIYEQVSDLPKAEMIYRELLASKSGKEGADSTTAAATRASLGRNLLDQQKFAAAEPVLRDALSVREKKLPDNWQTFNTRSVLGGALAGQKKFAEAEPLLVSGYEGMKQREGKMTASTKGSLKEALERLVRFYTDWGQPEKAAAWQQKLDRYTQAVAQQKAAGNPPAR